MNTIAPTSATDASIVSTLTAPVAAASHPSADSGRIRIEHLSVRVGQGAQAFNAVRDINLDVAPGEFVCVLGPSGCGKSTLLAALAGHLRPSAGRVLVNERPIGGPDPERGLVFQQHTLFPWKKLIDNVAFGLKMRGIGQRERQQRAQAMLDLVGLANAAQLYPSQLSGGMQQRAEIARVLINRPKLMLMDEPFGALDAQTRTLMQQHLLQAWARVRTTIVFITHDIDEALFLADRVLVMSPRPGRIVAEFALAFARPRGAALLTEPGFSALKRQCLALLAHPDPASAPASDSAAGPTPGPNLAAPIIAP